MEKYLFLFLKTGGGHFAPAKAVADQIKTSKKNNIEIILSDGLSGSKQFVKKIIEDGYKYTVNRAIWIFSIIYAVHKIEVISRLTATVMSYYIKPGIEKQIINICPGKIVLYHFFLIKPVLKILKERNLDIPVIIVVTDPFTAHPIWFLEKNQNYIVFSELLKEHCLKRGIRSNNLHIFPFVLDNRFSRKISETRKLIIRKNLGFKPDSKIILIIGGGDGMPGGTKIVKRILSNELGVEIAVVCGKNQKYFDQVAKLKARYGLNDVKVYGFIDFVHPLINISDIVITKCGASTCMEILLMDKVPIINKYIWEQEKGNMEFICKGGMGILEKSTRSLPSIISKLLTDSELYNLMLRNIKNASIKNGVEQVSEYILGC